MTDATPTPPPALPAPPLQPVSRLPEWLAPLALILAVLAFASAGVVFWLMQARLQDMEVQLARRIGQFDASSQEARAAAQAARQTIDSVVTRIGALEAKAQETQSQQLALEAVYQDLARGQDERLLADLEQTLLLADQQLQMAGNVRAALLGLDAVENRLNRMRKARFDRLREAVAHDAARLKLLPAADLTGLNARLDALVAGVDQLKMESEPETVKPAVPEPASGPVDWLGRLGRETWAEIKQLVRLRRIDTPGVELLSPAQHYFLRENLKLRLLSARLALLQRDEATFQGDIAVAHQWLVRYFQSSDPLTEAMARDLKAMASVPVALKEADLRGSLAALRALAPETP